MQEARVPEMPEELPEMQADVGGAQVSLRGERAVVDFQPGMDRVSADDSDEHSVNLAEELDDTTLDQLANRIIDYVEVDEASRADWSARLEQALELLGLRNRPEEDLLFEGASAVTYPLIGEAVVQFQARAVEEVFPSEGPVKTRVIGRRSVEKEAQSERVMEHMNYQMMEQDKSYFWNVDQMLFFLPLGGSAFKKSYYDPTCDMVVSRFIKANDFIVPYSATDLESSPRYTHRLRKTDSQMKKLVSGGFYRDVPLMGEHITQGEMDRGRVVLDEADSRTPSAHEDDIEYVLFETHIDLELESDQKKYDVDYPLPYVVTVEKESRKVVSIRRNWKEDDELRRKRMWFTHYRYLPGLGFYGFGLLHMIGSVAESASGSIRALLDSAAFANMQGGFISEDVIGLQGGDIRIEPGLYKRVKGSAEEIARGVYTPQFKEPSQALVKLFELLVESAQRFASATDQMVGDAANTGPVGTTIALIEQGSKVFSGIHRRLHMAAAEEFHLRAELNFEFLDEEYPYEVEGEERTIMRQDYDGKVDVIPVSDPNIFSTAQRIAQAQALKELSESAPDIYDRVEVHKRFLKAIRIPDPDSVLIDHSKPRCDPVTENVKMMTGQPASAFIDQDHEAHITTHMNFISGLNEEAMEMVGPPMQAHLAEHYAYKYWVQMNQQLGGQLLPPDQVAQLDEEGGMPPEMDQQLAQMAAQVPPVEIMPPDEPSPDDAQLKQAEWEQDQQRRQQTWEMDEERKQLAWELEQQRRAEGWEGEEERKDVATVTKVAREQQTFAEKVKGLKAKGKQAKPRSGGDGNKAS